MSSSAPGPRVGLFVTCLVDALRPSVGFATVDLLEAAGCRVEVPPAQTCCGQPGGNGGDVRTARVLARRTLETFHPYDYVVTPSGSCAAEIKHRYRELLADEPEWLERHAQLAAKTFEILGFLHDVRGLAPPPVAYRGRVTYQDTCSGLRQLAVFQQARALFANAPGIEWVEMEGHDGCCGFGGTFCVKYPALSERIAADKVRAVHASGADTLLVPDLGCLLHLAGKLHRLGSPVRCFHPVEVLANRTSRAVCEGGGR